MLELIHMTAVYSNAVLVAALPYVSDFAKKLDLPIQQPITTNQVKWSKPSPFKGFPVDSVILTNRYWFEIHPRGYVEGFRAPTNWFFEQEFTDENIPKYLGHDSMTTNEALEMARQTLLKLGWGTNLTHSYETPETQGPYDLNKKGRVNGHVPYCQFTWEWPTNATNLADVNRIQVEINLERKTLVGLALGISRTNVLTTTPVKVDMVPELESEYRKRIKATNKMFINTNAPKHFPKASN